MEAIIGIIAVVVGWGIFRWVLSAGFRTVGAAAKATVGKGSFSENMELAFKGMGPMEVQFNHTRLGEDGKGAIAKAIEVKGLFPVNTSRNVGFVTSVLDKTGENYEPVLSPIEMFQEPYSVVYQSSVEIGVVSPSQGFVGWTRVGVVLPEILTPPFAGKRNFVAVLRLVDLDDMPEIVNGYSDSDGSGLLWQRVLEFEYSVEGKGYKEAAEHRDRARALSVEIGMAVAMADGSLDDREGETLKNWIIKFISPFSDEKRDHLRELYNEAMKQAYSAAKSGNLSLSELTKELNDIAENSTKYDTIELCFDVMAADGVADAEELKVIRKVADALNLDFDEIEKMRDQKIIGLDTSVSNQASIEDILGIEPDWSQERIKRHLRTEFQKWNNRINTLSEGEERDNAQRMLDLIAEARMRHE